MANERDMESARDLASFVLANGQTNGSETEAIATALASRGRMCGDASKPALRRTALLSAQSSSWSCSQETRSAARSR